MINMLKWKRPGKEDQTQKQRKRLYMPRCLYPFFVDFSLSLSRLSAVVLDASYVFRASAKGEDEWNADGGAVGKSLAEMDQSSFGALIDFGQILPHAPFTCLPYLPAHFKIVRTLSNRAAPLIALLCTALHTSTF